MISRLPAGASIGVHRHTAGSEVNYVVSGTGRAVCDGVKEELPAGSCHYCLKGSERGISNAGPGDLFLFTVVPEQ